MRTDVERTIGSSSIPSNRAGAGREGMSAPLTPVEQTGLVNAMAGAGIDFEEKNTLTEIERKLALMVWLAAKAHYTAETERLREALAENLEAVRFLRMAAMAWEATSPGSYDHPRVLDALDLGAAALAPHHSTGGMDAPSPSTGPETR